MYDLLKHELSQSVAPDAWKLERDDGKVHVTAVEVEVTSAITKRKLKVYDRIWWNVDGTDNMFFHVVICDRFGSESDAPLPLLYNPSAMDACKP